MVALYVSVSRNAMRMRVPRSRPRSRSVRRMVRRTGTELERIGARVDRRNHSRNSYVIYTSFPAYSCVDLCTKVFFDF